MTVLPAHSYVWTIRETDTGVTYVLSLLHASRKVKRSNHPCSYLAFKMAAEPAFWGLANAGGNSQVSSVK